MTITFLKPNLSGGPPSKVEFREGPTASRLAEKQENVLGTTWRVNAIPPFASCGTKKATRA